MRSCNITSIIILLCACRVSDNNGMKPCIQITLGGSLSRSILSYVVSDLSVFLLLAYISEADPFRVPLSECKMLRSYLAGSFIPFPRPIQ